MTSITQFDDLPDLFIIDLFTYLSSIDVLWTFANLNDRFRTLVDERGFFRHVNLSSARLARFNTLLTRLPLNEIETLIVDIGASSFQLTRWPHLPSLTTLRLYGLRDSEDATSFILRHALTLTHLTLQTNDRFMSLGFGGKILYPRVRLETLVEDILPHMTSLRSLDLGQDTGFGLTNLEITTTPIHLTYLRLSLADMAHLYRTMSSKTLSTNLEQLHVTFRSNDPLCEKLLPVDLELPPMMNLHTFALMQTVLSDNRIQWSTIESITAPDHMPVLRRVNLAVFITVDDLYGMNKSLLFTDDHRRIDVQFAFIHKSASVDIHLIHQMLCARRFHSREVVGVTCVSSYITLKYQHVPDINCHYEDSPRFYDVWYTLPWIFQPFFDVFPPWRYLTKSKPFPLAPSCSSKINPSRLRTLTISEKDSSSTISMPHVVQLDRIDTFHLLFHDWPIGLNLPSLRHLTLTNNLNVLKSFTPFPPSIRSIQILLYPYMPNQISNNWSVLRSLSALPMLTSLQIVLYDMQMDLDEHSCQIIAETVPILVHFGICFRTQCGKPTDYAVDYYVLNPANCGFDLNNLTPEDLNYLSNLPHEEEEIDDEVVNPLYDMYQRSIEEIHRRLLRLSFPTKPLIVVDEEGYGLDVWL